MSTLRHYALQLVCMHDCYIFIICNIQTYFIMYTYNMTPSSIIQQNLRLLFPPSDSNNTYILNIDTYTTIGEQTLYDSTTFLLRIN